MLSVEELRASLDSIGLTHVEELYHNLSTAELYEHAISFDEAALSEHGALVAVTAPHTGRSANDKFLVDEPSSTGNVWWGKVNKKFPQDKFNALKSRVFAYLQGHDLYVLDCMAGSDDKYRLPVRVIGQKAWHNLFAKNMFIAATESELENFAPGFTIVHAPDFKADPAIDGTRSETFIVLDFSQKIVIIGGTQYAGEVKKSIFTVLNYLLPLENVMSMHCSANIGASGDTALFFGLSGTGKTTLSTDPERALIGDDEHGWSNDGTFNFEGGCYAKVINLSAEAEPIIYQTTRVFGTILENVVMDPYSRKIDLFDDSITENTRASYSRDILGGIAESNKGGHPTNIFFLSCDAFGVMPPVSRLTPEQAMYHFLSGYTAKVAGTEKGVKEPTATFSACFGAPFMVHHPKVYANLLRDKINAHGAQVWLVNTGWSGGEYGVGKRMKIDYTRALLRAVLSGDLKNAEYVTEPFFGLQVPTSCNGVPSEILNPRNTWADVAAYDAKAKHLVGLFAENYKQFE
ncbi:phosphoenolpyruvate carboxykinase (ATP) [Ignavibacteria bacterium]|nr:phosphoenolpyruvate carboxykinase (ATP) [Bacteroidota bacterium]MCZ2132345.1 phosphoenolpyruvate carboxykinase (ATP) [Bacteroidota bacterium]